MSMADDCADYPGQQGFGGCVGESEVTSVAGQGGAGVMTWAEGRSDPNSHPCSAPSCLGGLGRSLGMEPRLAHL